MTEVIPKVIFSQKTTEVIPKFFTPLEIFRSEICFGEARPKQMHICLLEY